MSRKSTLLGALLGGIVVFAISSAASAATLQFTQQGPKLVGTGVANVAPGQAQVVAISGDGNTILVGGSGDDNTFPCCVGATWVFTRSGGVWTQQGPKLVGTGALNHASQGFSVSLSTDGNTALIGAPSDHTGIGGTAVGAAWVFTRSGGVWTQQAKLVGTGLSGPSASQGFAVALSGDGNTAVLGGPGDGGGGGLGPSIPGAAWVFTRSGGVWTQQAKLVDNTSVARSFGSWVTASADGNTVAVGATDTNASAGGVYVYTRAGGVWTQEAGPLSGSGAAGAAQVGFPVSLSSDGNTLAAGGVADNGGAGAAWVFTRSGTAWSQQGGKLVGTGAAGSPAQGIVSLSGDGNTLLSGGSTDNGNAGAAWVFTRAAGVWTQQNAKLTGSGAAGNARQGASTALSSDGLTAVLGGYGDNSFFGATWVFVGSLVGGGATAVPVLPPAGVVLLALLLGLTAALRLSLPRTAGGGKLR